MTGHDVVDHERTQVAIGRDYDVIFGFGFVSPPLDVVLTSR